MVDSGIGPMIVMCVDEFWGSGADRVPEDWCKRGLTIIFMVWGGAVGDVDNLCSLVMIFRFGEMDFGDDWFLIPKVYLSLCRQKSEEFLFLFFLFSFLLIGLFSYVSILVSFLTKLQKRGYICLNACTVSLTTLISIVQCFSPRAASALFPILFMWPTLGLK